MRIDEIKKDLQKHYNIIKDIPQTKGINSSTAKLINLQPYIESIHYLFDKYSAAFPSILYLKDHFNNVFHWSQKEITATISEINTYVGIFKDIKNEMEQNISLLEIISPTFETGYYLKIKLPECSDTSQLAKFFNDIHYILEQTDKYYSDASGAFELYDFQHGSRWTDFKVKSGKAIAAIALLLGLASDAFDVTENIRNVINLSSKIPTTSSEQYLEELKQEKTKIIRTETKKYVEKNYSEISEEGEKHVLINTTTKIIEKTTIILENGGAFQIEIVGDPEALDNEDILAIDEKLLKQIEEINNKQLEISNSLKAVPSYPQLALPESEQNEVISND